MAKDSITRRGRFLDTTLGAEARSTFLIAVVAAWQSIALFPAGLSQGISQLLLIMTGGWVPAFGVSVTLSTLGNQSHVWRVQGRSCISLGQVDYVGQKKGGREKGAPG
jgi:hypothetical protein